MQYVKLRETRQSKVATPYNYTQNKEQMADFSSENFLAFLLCNYNLDH